MSDSNRQRDYYVEQFKVLQKTIARQQAEIAALRAALASADKRA